MGNGINSNTKLMLHLNGNFTDSSPSSKAVSSSGSPILSSSKFGNGAIYFNGVDTSLTVPDSDAWQYGAGGTGPFTIDFWYKTNSLATQYILSQYSGDNNNNLIVYFSPGGTMYFSSEVGGAFTVRWTVAMPVGSDDGEWHHYAIVRETGANSETDWGFYFDGVEVTGKSLGGGSWDGTIVNRGEDLRIGALNTTSNVCNGYLDELRISNVARYTTNFSVPTVPHVSDENTNLLLNLDNDTIIDAGGESHTVTPQGAPMFVGSKFGNGCAYFDGTGDYLALPASNDFAFLANNTEDWTIDLWFNPETVTTSMNLFGMGPGTNNETFVVVLDVSSQLYVRARDASSAFITTGLVGSVLTVSTWYHLALVKQGTTYALYLDGIQISHSITSTEVSWTNLTFGKGPYTSNVEYFGCIDEIRIQKSNAFSASPNVGKTDTITVPTSEHTTDADTKLLMHFNENFEDSSNIGHTVSVLGDSLVTIKKFGDASLQLNGTSQYLTAPDSTDWDVIGNLSDDYMIDFWMKMTKDADVRTVISQGNYPYVWKLYINDSTAGVRLYVNNGGTMIFADGGQASYDLVNDNAWHHIAIVKRGEGSTNDYGIYIDGDRVAQVTDAMTFTISEGLDIGIARGSGGTPVQYFDGFLDEVRIKKASDLGIDPSVDTTITVPTSAHTADADTKLLLHLNGDAKDSSGKGHVVSAIGDTAINTSIKKFGNGSAEFDGTGDYLSIPSSDAFDFGSGDFTIDFWVRFKTIASWTAIINKALSASSSDRDIQIGTNSTSNITARVYQGSTTYVVNGTTALSTVTWYHVAFIRSGNNLNLYINGVAEGGTTDVSSMTGHNNSSAPLNIGYDNTGGFLAYFNGYLDEVSITKEARWTSNFTSPTLQYTTDSNTKLLIHADNDFNDYSEIGHDVATHNDPRFNYTKFGSGALFLDGTGDYLTVPDSNDWDVFGSTTEDWTIDFWMNSKGTGSMAIIGQGNDTSNNWGITHHPAGIYSFIRSGGVGTLHMMSDVVVGTGVWTHIALVRLGTIIAIYINGEQEGYVVLASTYNFTNPLRIGWGYYSPYVPYDGMLDEIRIQKSNAFSASPNVGKTDTITVPTSEHTADADTKLLMHFNGSFTEEAGDHTVTVLNDTKIVGSKFGTHAIDFNGTSQYLTVPDSDDWAFGSGDFTIDCWCKFNDLTTLRGHTIFSQVRVSDVNTRVYGYLVVISATEIRLNFNHKSGVTAYNAVYDSSVGEIIENTWQHFAIERHGNNFNWYIDGQLMNTTVLSFTCQNISNVFTIGSLEYPAGNSNFFEGSIDEFRVSKGIARYGTSGFTPSTSEYTADSYDKLLLHLNGDTVDSSLTPHTVTEVNDPTTVYTKFEGALHFDGVNDYLTLADSGDWDVFATTTEYWTIDFWIKFNSAPSAGGTIISQYQSSSDWWSIRLDASGTILFNLKVGGSVKIDMASGPSITDADWHHVAFCKKGSDYGVYLDGNQGSFINNTDTGTNSGVLYLGIRIAGSTVIEECHIDEFRFHKADYFGANPVVGLTDTITVPTEEYELEIPTVTAKNQTVIIT